MKWDKTPLGSRYGQWLITDRSHPTVSGYDSDVRYSLFVMDAAKSSGWRLVEASPSMSALKDFAERRTV